MRAQMPYIMAADHSAYFNFRVNIYYEALDTVYYSNTTVGQVTEAEQIYLPPDKYLFRSSYLSKVATAPDFDPLLFRRVTFKSQPHFRFVENQMYRYA